MSVYVSHPAGETPEEKKRRLDHTDFGRFCLSELRDHLSEGLAAPYVISGDRDYDPARLAWVQMIMTIRGIRIVCSYSIDEGVIYVASGIESACCEARLHEIEGEWAMSGDLTPYPDQPNRPRTDLKPAEWALLKGLVAAAESGPCHRHAPGYEEPPPIGPGGQPLTPR